MAEGWIQVAIDGAGKRVRNLLLNVAGTDVYQQVVGLAKSDGTLIDDLASQTTAAAIKARTDNLDIALSALRDAIAGAGAGTKTQADIVAAIAAVQQVTVNNWPADQLVHAATLPLPAGAATDASLGSITDLAPGPYTVLGRLTDIARRTATESTLKQVLVALQKPQQPTAKVPSTTLLHRS